MSNKEELYTLVTEYDKRFANILLRQTKNVDMRCIKDGGITVNTLTTKSQCKRGEIVVEFEHIKGGDRDWLIHTTDVGEYNKEIWLDLERGDICDAVITDNSIHENMREVNDEDIKLFSNYLKTKTQIAEAMI